ncbi:MAG: hypothetical protein D6790_16610 [Caldilineae bacterium]|nr:MAG: hypothetical protein D6790_16610 [Caldilineae bacterium]
MEWLWFRQRRLQSRAAPVSTGPNQARMEVSAQHPAPPGSVAQEDYTPYTPPAALEQIPSGEAPRAVSYPDNLTEIRGIGDVYEQRLYQAGIFTWHQLAHTDPETLRQVTKALPTSDVNSWIEQAHQLAQERGREGAVYTGPTPDNLTQIPGIDQIFEEHLYQAGIVTFAQLARLSPQALGEIIPAHQVGDNIDFTAWIERAAALSQNS